jgi:hypothetical protein
MVLSIIVAGECSGTIRDAFARRGHNAWSCDIKPSAKPGQHYQGSWHDIHWPSFDLLIAHPVCTHLAVSGAAHFAAKKADGRQQAAIDEFMFLANAPVRMKAIEQPISIMSSLYRKPDQIIQPHQFGHDASKSTCLWLTGLPNLLGTNNFPPRIVNGKSRWSNQTNSGQNKLGPSDERAALRAVTYQGIADAMAVQWGGQVDRVRVAA